jgi:hypothetical protein
LIELRRIKVLEIQQDREIMLGRAAYNPRSKEGKDYAAMLASSTESGSVKSNPSSGTEKSEEPAPDLTEQNEMVSISPEMAQSLAEPFSRDLIMPGYEDRISIKANTKPDVQLQRRIDANTSLMSALQSEISIFSAATKAPGNENSVALKIRYEELLAERSSLVDEITADKKMLQELNLSADIESEKAEVKNGNTEKDVLTRSKSLPVASVEVAAFKATFAESQKKIQNAGMSPFEEKTALADMNRQQSASIESRIDELAEMLDNTSSVDEQDQIQLAIQELSALSADKLQEADRLTVEAGNIPSIAITDVPAIAPETKSDSQPVTAIDSEELDAEALLVNTSETMELGSMAYKSLNASIRANDLDAQMKQLASEREKSEKLLNSYTSENDPVRKAQLYDDFISSATGVALLQNDVRQEISKSNEAEIAFYSNSNVQNISKLEADSVLTEAEVTKLEKLKAEWTELSKNLESTRSRSRELSVMQSSDQNALLRGEIVLVSQLAVVNSAISELSKIADTRRAEELAGLAMANDSGDTFESNPSNHIPLPNKTYITPVVAKYAANTTETEIRELKTSDQALNVDLSIGRPSTPEADAELVNQIAEVDNATMSSLNKKPAQIQYLSAKIKSDSLKTIEYSLADQALDFTSQANERNEESKRLKELAAVETNTNDSKLLAERASRIAAEAEVFYKKAAIAATAAEEARSLRTAQQQNITVAANSLKAIEIAELDKVLKGEPYKIITADLAGNESTIPKNNASATDPGASQIADNNTIPKTSASAESLSDPNSKPVATYWLGMIEIIAEKSDFSDVKENMFVPTEASLYSKAKPIPMDPPMPAGLIFQVQVGAFKNPIPQDMFKSFAPVMGQKLDNGIVRYRAGIFTIYRDAVSARDAIRQLGYKDAFVIAYLDGERLSAEEARIIVKGLPAAETSPVVADPILASKQPEVNPVNVNTEKSATQPESSKPTTISPELPEKVTYYNDPNAAVAAPVEVIAGLFFTVQAGVYSKPVALDKLYNLTELNTELTAQNTIRYTTGRFNSVSEASVRKQAVQRLGVADAFVTAYYNGRRISVNEANALLNEQGSSVLALKASESKEVFVVVLGVFSGDVPQEFANAILERPDLNIRSIAESSEISIFVSSEFTDRKSAEDYRTKAISAGLTDAYIARWVNGKAIR